MKKIVFQLFILSIIISCNNNSNKNNSENNNSDTIYKNYFVRDNDLWLEKITKDTIIEIEFQKYKLETQCQLDTFVKFNYTELIKKGKQIIKNTYYGYDGKYSFILKDSTNKTIFKTLLNKSNFKNIVSDYFLSNSNVYNPIYLYYLKEFDSFVFSIYFGVTNSDFGAEYIIIINKNGDITNISLSNNFGGSGCDCEVKLPTHKKYILTGHNIIHSSGKIINIDNINIPQIGIRLINDNCILIVQEFNDSTKSHNAKLIDSNGNTIKEFTYRGYYRVLDNHIADYYDSITKCFYISDDELKNLRIINISNPENTTIIDFNKMEKSKLKKKCNEISFDINTEFSEKTFFVDTITLKIRFTSNN